MLWKLICEPSEDNGEKRSCLRAEQKVQAEGAARLTGMSGHEQSVSVLYW